MATQILGKEGINYVRSTNPAYRLREVDQTAPAGMWQMDASSGNLLFQCATAADWSAFTTVVTMTSAPSITIHGTITFSGTVVFSANVRLDDDITILYGDDSDYYMGYSATADVLEIGTGSTINTNVAMVVDSSGNIGVAINSLEPWGTGYHAIQLGGGGSWMSGDAGAGNSFLNNNNYWDGAAWKYQHTDEALQVWLRDGMFTVRTAVSGTEDTAITWVEVIETDTTGAIFCRNLDSGATGTTLIITGGGEVILDSSSLANKENIHAIDSDSNLVFDLTPVSFNWKKDGNSDFGLIAEDVAEILPELVTFDEEGAAIAVRYDRLSVLLLMELEKLKNS